MSTVPEKRSNKDEKGSNNNNNNKHEIETPVDEDNKQPSAATATATNDLVVPTMPSTGTASAPATIRPRTDAGKSSYPHHPPLDMEQRRRAANVPVGPSTSFATSSQPHSSSDVSYAGNHGSQHRYSQQQQQQQQQHHSTYYNPGWQSAHTYPTYAAAAAASQQPQLSQPAGTALAHPPVMMMPPNHPQQAQLITQHSHTHQPAQQHVYPLIGPPVQIQPTTTTATLNENNNNKDESSSSFSQTFDDLSQWKPQKQLNDNNHHRSSSLSHTYHALLAEEEKEEDALPDHVVPCGIGISMALERQRRQRLRQRAAAVDESAEPGDPTTKSKVMTIGHVSDQVQPATEHDEVLSRALVALRTPFSVKPFCGRVSG